MSTTQDTTESTAPALRCHQQGRAGHPVGILVGVKAAEAIIMSRESRLEAALNKAGLADEMFLRPGYAAWDVVLKWHESEVTCLLTIIDAELRALFDLQRSRVESATSAWQKAHDKPDVLPDLGELIVWLMQKAGFDEADYAEDEAAKIARAKKIVESCFAHDPRLDGLKFTEAGPDLRYEPGEKPWSDQNE